MDHHCGFATVEVDADDSCSKRRTVVVVVVEERTVVLLLLLAHKTCPRDYCFERDCLLDVEVTMSDDRMGCKQTHVADVLDYSHLSSDATRMEMPEVDP